ncbi:hypothetical protein [Mucilaginibacter sp.]|uniref:hypothetical protein n=1 Tax=Mucilaginibacter sp. TaxID=1882438 RepID=UPI0025DBFC6B|nr:hypothetical protein [Mucilaginibacter sp.]
MDTNISNITVTGQVVDSVEKTGMAGLLVTALENAANGATIIAGDVLDQGILGTAKTDENGRFNMALTDPNLARGLTPDLFFNVYDVDGKTLLTSTADYVVWNGSTQEDVTIKIRREAVQPIGKDRVNTLQMRKAAVFLTQSDFTGVLTQVKSQAGTSFGVLGDSVMSAISKINLTPLKVSVPANSVVNTNVAAAGQTLTDQNIPYQVVDYNPGLNKDLLQSVSGIKPVLGPGESVKLYQENGVVKYYSVVTDTTATPPASAASAAPPASSATIDHSADIAKLQEQLTTTQNDAAAKDKHIADLTAQLEAVRKEQASIKEMFNAKFNK